MTKIGDARIFFQRFSICDYFKLMEKNRNYRLYLFSHMCQHCGDWFIRIASLISIQRISGGSSTALSMVVMCRTIPEVLIAPFGGVLADKYDRKWLMIRLDCLAAFSVLFYIYAVQVQSINLLYATTAVRSAIAAAYMPVTHALVPLIVSGKEDLKRAGTINGMIWSGMLLFGGVVAGGASAKFGVEFCYAIDCITYLISAMIISRVRGNFIVESIRKGKNEEPVEGSLIKKSLPTVMHMIKEMLNYLNQSSFGLLIFLKACGCLIWGSADVLNVSFANVEGDEAETSRRMGMLYSSIGLGCLIGPIIANSTLVDGERPSTLQLAIIGGLVFMAGGWLGLASNTSSFQLVCTFTSLRTIGSAILWLFSTLILQNLAKPEFLGRILGLEYCLARVAETIIAFVAGKMEDAGHSASEISYQAAGIAIFFCIFWTVYHIRGKGAAQPKFNSVAGTDSGKETEKILEYEDDAVMLITRP